MNMAIPQVTEPDYRRLRGGESILFIIQEFFKNYSEGNYNYNENLFLDFGNQKFFNVSLEVNFLMRTSVKMKFAEVQSEFIKEVDLFFDKFNNTKRVAFEAQFNLQLNETKIYIVILKAQRIKKKFIIQPAVGQSQLFDPEFMTNKIYDVIKSAGPEGITLSQLTRKTQKVRSSKVSKNARKAMLEELISSERIKVEHQKRNAKMRTIYKVL